MLRTWLAGLAVVSILALPIPVLAQSDELPAPEAIKLFSPRISRVLESRARKGAISAPLSDTTWVGYTSGHSADNYWSIYAGSGADGYRRGTTAKGVWNWEETVHGDSLQGWWPLSNVWTSTGGLTLTDDQRPWWALDFGNMANYRINEANGRTFGVVGVWHRDAGRNAGLADVARRPRWNAPSGTYAAWMGLRSHGDATYADPLTGNPFNEDVMMFTKESAASAGGNDAGFPGYGSQMDQMLYRDLDFTGNTSANLTVHFKFKTVMSTSIGTAPSTRTGWFDRDPLSVTSGNFISSSAAGSAAPCDSFMVYVGSAVEGNPWLGSDGVSRPVYDPQRRWFGEVVRPDSAGFRLHRELLSVAGNHPADTSLVSNAFVDTTLVIPNSLLSDILAYGTRVRLVFRVKTNRGLDDQDPSYSSGQKGAAIVDNVTVQIGSGAVTVLGEFENASDINNDPAVSAYSAWKSTGKPPGIFHHVHALSTLPYQPPCDDPGAPYTPCNMGGVVVSAGDHDHGEAAGGPSTTPALVQRSDGIMSPTIQLVGPYNGPGGTNACGLKAAGAGAGDIQAAGDYFIGYDLYAGIMNPYTQGNLWRFGVMSYPGNAKSSSGAYPSWGQMRFPPFIYFNPEPACLSDLEPLIANQMLRTSNASGIPDSIRIFVGKTQQCFRFAVSLGCSPTDGCYWDNVSFGIVDTPSPVTTTPSLSVNIYDWFNDAFPANETAGLPGTLAFDTTAALVKTGRNIAQGSADQLLRFDIPGDSLVALSDTALKRVDLVFRILPGPGNYQISSGHTVLLQVPTNQAAVAVPGDASFWGQYMATPGDFATPNASALHQAFIPGGWNPSVWNSARCDSAELNIFPVKGTFNVVSTGLRPGLWAATYHESDPHYATLGINKFKCFVVDTTQAATSSPTLSNVNCSGVVPAWLTTVPQSRTGWDGNSTTKEFTKIIPDGLLTPGSHVEYFLRVQTGTAPGTATVIMPDTNRVLQPGEGSTDGHRWQEFSVLPNLWKRQAYMHPVTHQGGTGLACMLVVDAADRRGNETAWVGIADTIGATPQRYWGAHNGWHAIGGGNLDNPADNRRPDGTPGFISEHLGPAGSGGTWDMYQIKGSEDPSNAAGSMGSRIANRSSMGFAAGKYSVQGPTPEMLRAYYSMILYLTGDISTPTLGPFVNHSQNEVAILADFLTQSAGTPNRGFWAMGDGFARSNVTIGGSQANLMLNDLGCGFVSTSYRALSGDHRPLAGLRYRVSASSPYDSIGVLNACPASGQSNDVLRVDGIGLTLGSVASEYYGPAGAFASGVFKDFSSTSHWKSLVSGWDIENLTGMFGNTWFRSNYFYQMFASPWSSICTIDGALTPLDVPDSPAVASDFVSLANNPLVRGHATIRLGFARADLAEVNIYDVSGRLVRTLARRFFTPGIHELFWDGFDNAQRPAARGIYFTRVAYRSGFTASTKVTVLK